MFPTLGQSTARGCLQTVSSGSLVFRSCAMSTSRLGNMSSGLLTTHLAKPKSPMDWWSGRRTWREESRAEKICSAPEHSCTHRSLVLVSHLAYWLLSCEPERWKREDCGIQQRAEPAFGIAALRTLRGGMAVWLYGANYVARSMNEIT